MLTSILHRMTGVALGAGILYFACWLVALSIGEDAYNAVQAFHATWIGRAILLGFAWALIYHMLNGIRHLVWDTGRALDMKTATAGGWLVLVGTVVLAAALLGVLL